MKLYVFTLAFFLSAHLSAQQIIFVKYDAAGSNSGTSWQNAFTHLQSAVQNAQYGDQIWVAAGTYLPTVGIDRNSTFFLPKGVSLWGGFNGQEQSISQRNFVDNLTILSGDIGVPNMNSDNVYHVVSILGGDALTIIDGFKIRVGNADGQDNGGISSRNAGGGILIATDNANPIAAPIIRNCLFEQNRGIRGGGIACIGSGAYASVPEITACTFLQNRAENYGGSLFKDGINLPESPFKIENCLFERNYCQNFSGGIFITNPSGCVLLRGCTFYKDTGRIGAGAVYFASGNPKMRYEIDSCSFTANYSYAGCGALYQLTEAFFNDTVRIIVRNSDFILNKNTFGEGGGMYSGSFGKYHQVNISDCFFWNNFSQNSGGGILIEGGDGFTKINVDRAFFLGNTTGATDAAGAFFYRGSSNTLLKNQSTISNSVFMFNTGALACLSALPSNTDTRVVNSSFYRNGKNPFLKYWKPDIPVGSYSKMQLLNCVIWEPQTVGVERVFYNNDPINLNVKDYLVEHSLIHLASCGYNGVDPCGEGMIYGTWPDFVDSSGQIGLVPWPSFPGLNKGSSLVADTFNLTKDFDGIERVFCDTVDIGAYEIHANCFSSTLENPYDFFLPNIKILQNPARFGSAIQVEIFSITNSTLNIQLFDATGRSAWSSVKKMNASFPEIVEIPTASYCSGIYFIVISDEQGRRITEKVVIQ